MNRTEMIDVIAERTGFVKADIAIVLDAFTDVATEALVDGKVVKVRAFGAFHPIEFKARNVRNPHDGVMMTIKPHNTIKFKPSKTLRDAIN